jgi:membrane protein YdbS with pleckstrin-like domain
MSYVDEHLLPGEEVVYRASLHWTVLLGPILAAVALLVLGTVVVYSFSSLGWLVALLALVPLLWAYISYTSSEFAVTNKRVVIKSGWIQRNTVEILLGKVEAIGVDQGLAARLLGYGTITVTGTGGTDERFARLAQPLEFRRQVQAQVSAGEAEWKGQGASGRAAAASAEAPAGVREERDCPYCAERILVRARVCKHCGRDVEPLVGS